jgi:dynein heavy chain
MKNPEEDENLLALRSLFDVNLPKFTSNDIPLFVGIVNDLFPGIEVPAIDYGILLSSIVDSCEYQGLQPKKEFKNKCI